MPNEINPSGSWLFGLVSVIPLFALVSSLDSFNQALRWGGIWGIGFTLVQYFWLSRFGDFSLWTLSGVSLVYFGYGSLYFGFLRWGLGFKGYLQPLALAFIVTSFDYLRSIGYLAFPWNLLAHPFARNLYLIQSVQIGGVFILIFLVAYTQGVLYSLIKLRLILSTPSIKDNESNQTQLNHGVFLILLWSLNLGYGFSVLHEPLDKNFNQVELDLILIQQNQDSWALANREQGMVDLQRLTLQTIESTPILLGGKDFEDRSFQPDLTLWSETSLTFSPQSLLNASDRFPQALPFLSFLESLDSPLLTGAPVYVDPRVPQQGLMNGAVVFEPIANQPLNDEQQELLYEPYQGWNISYSYGKQRLIPFAEHVPTGDIPFLSRFLEEQIGISGSGWQVGRSLEPFELIIPGGRISIGIPICFEDSFFQHTRAMTLAGSNVFINLTNNSWSGTHTAHGQHTAAMIFRTVETRRPMIRSTNSGLTSVIDNLGRIIWSLPEFETLGAGIRVELAIPENYITFYTFWGDWFAFLCLIGISLLFLADNWKNLPKKGDDL